MNNEFVVNGSPEILGQLKVNVLYFDNDTSPLFTYYKKGETHAYEGAAEGYVLYINYKDALFFRAYCDRNPEHFEYSTKKGITVEQRDEKFYANVVFLKSQEEQERRYDASTQMLTLRDALATYQDEFHPATWPKRIPLESRLGLSD